MKSQLRGVVQQPSTARQGGREEHLGHAGMNEGQLASSRERLQGLEQELCSPHEPASG